jgi:hypothetical protein
VAGQEHTSNGSKDIQLDLGLGKTAQEVTQGEDSQSCNEQVFTTKDVSICGDSNHFWRG